MGLTDDLLQSVSAFDCDTKRVAIGLHWTVVESRSVGTAHTYKARETAEIADAGKLSGKSALELARRLKSDTHLEASLGLAALNSLIEPSGSQANALEIILERAPGKTVTIVGRFPFNNQVVATAGKVNILEIEPKEGELPAAAAPEVIPQSDITVITATAIINKTISGLLELARKTFTIVLGPSTPMNDVLFEYGADVVAGVKVVDSQALFSGITQGIKAFKNLPGIQALVRTRD